MVPELNSNKSIKNRVQAAVQVGNSLQSSLGHFQSICKLAVNLVRHADGVVQKGNVIRKVADDKHHHHSQHHPHRFMSLEVFSFHQCDDDGSVAEDHDKQWQEEANSELDARDQHFKNRSQISVVIFEVTHIMMFSGLILPFVWKKESAVVKWLVPVIERKCWDGHKDSKHPDDSADQAAVGQRTEPEAPAGLDNCKVTVYADAAQQQHAAVQVYTVGTAQQLAGNPAHGPGCHLIVDNQWQRKHKQKVSNGNVEQVEVSHGLGPFVESVGDDDQAVPHQAQSTDDGVNKWEYLCVHTTVQIVEAGLFIIKRHIL